MERSEFVKNGRYKYNNGYTEHTVKIQWIVGNELSLLLENTKGYVVMAIDEAEKCLISKLSDDEGGENMKVGEKQEAEIIVEPKQNTVTKASFVIGAKLIYKGRNDKYKGKSCEVVEALQDASRIKFEDGSTMTVSNRSIE